MRKRRSAALDANQTSTPAVARQPDDQQPKPPTDLQQQHSIAEKLGLKMDQAGNLDIPSLAYVLYSSKMFPDITSVSQGIVKIMVGREIGLAPMAAVMGIHIIKTKGYNNEPDKTTVMIGAHLIAAKIKASGRYDFDVIEMDHTRCELQPYVKRGEKWTELKRISFTVEEAKLAGYGGFGKDNANEFKKHSNWAKDPQAMCFARAMTRMEKVHFADITGMPTYTPDEMGYRTDDAGNALTVSGRLVPDEIGDEELQKMRTQQPEAAAAAQPAERRQVISGLKIARLQQFCQDKGWPLISMLDMAFGLNGYTDKDRAEQLWDGEAWQSLLELIADDTYDQVVKALDEAHDAWQQRTEGHAIDEAEAIIDGAKDANVTKVTPVTIVTESDQPANGAGDEKLDGEQYDDLWALVASNPKLIQATKDYAKEQLGYQGLKTLRDLKQKHLRVIVDFVQRWGQQ